MTRSKAPALIKTEQAQSEASDPAVCAWVGANAGAGKTHVLKMRVLRLLLAGTPPQRILCLTYTKAAAAEMSQRVFKDLAVWATAPSAKLAADLEVLLSRPASAKETADARRLFARAIETPGGLKVQTIHAFCERLLQRFPLEAGVPPAFDILDDETGSELKRRAIDAVLTRATGSPEAPLGRALETVVSYVQGDAFDTLISEAIAQRAWIASVGQLGATSSEADPFAAMERLYRTAFGLTKSDTVEDLEKRAASVLPDHVLARAIDVLGAGAKTEQKIAQSLRRASFATSSQEQLEAFCDAFLTQELKPRSVFVGKATRTAEPDLDEHLCRARDTFHALIERRDALIAVSATMALMRLADAVLDTYNRAKAETAALDFEDLVEKTANLLLTPGQADWVLYKLDGGLDHILVDESQDTSPAQWSVVQALAAEFFNGSGAREETRTVFAVGDEKQSIFSFQGAEPKRFAAVGRSFEQAAGQAGQRFSFVPLTLSFRTVPPVLEAVDRVFANPQRTPGVSASAQPIVHQPLRTGRAGLVELWPIEEPQTPDAIDAFSPLTERAVASPVNVIADRIATTIRRWLDEGELLPSEGRSIRAGDILVLVRSRRPLAPVMVSALKRMGIPVAGADRMLLTDQLAVQDLVALGQVMLLPEDDLSLAAVLKSPLFDLTDDDLIMLAPDRRGSLYSALMAKGRENDRFMPAADTLKRWRGIADFLPPYELYARILDNDGMRARLIGRLGPESGDAIDEFVAKALGYDDAHPPSLRGFLTSLALSRHEIKRDMEHGRDEVRVMTVHGSKGLEAPVVFLPDTCASGQSRGSSLLPMPALERPASVPPPFFWTIKNSSRLRPVADAKEAVQDAEAEERNRLLYVAMTRARDRLYVAGFRGVKKLADHCWYRLVEAGLEGHLVTFTQPDGSVVRRLESRQTEPQETPKGETLDRIVADAPPVWAAAAAPDERRTTVPLAPSRLAPLDMDEDGEIASSASPVPGEGHARSGGRSDGVSVRVMAGDPPAPAPRELMTDYRFLRGTITHALLQHLPTLAASGWETAASGFVQQRGAALPAGVRRGIVEEALAILRDPAFAAVFGPGSRAEVPIVAELADPSGQRPAVRVTGQIDRIVEAAGGILILDYKTNRPPPLTLDGVPDAYVLQLAAYRHAVAAIYGAPQVRAAILWTYGPRLMEIPAAVLDHGASRLWALT